jgi:hypothetical protein
MITYRKEKDQVVEVNVYFSNIRHSRDDLIMYLIREKRKVTSNTRVTIVSCHEGMTFIARDLKSSLL